MISLNKHSKNTNPLLSLSYMTVTVSHVSSVLSMLL